MRSVILGGQRIPYVLRFPIFGVLRPHAASPTVPPILIPSPATWSEVNNPWLINPMTHRRPPLPPPSPSFFRRHLHSLFRTTSHNSRVRVFVHHKMMCFYSGGVESIPCCECRACRVIPFYPSTHPIPYPSPSLHSRKTLPDRASSGHCGAHFPRPAPAAPPPFPFPFVRCVHSPDRSPANSRYVTCLSLCILTFPG